MCKVLNLHKIFPLSAMTFAREGAKPHYIAKIDIKGLLIRPFIFVFIRQNLPKISLNIILFLKNKKPYVRIRKKGMCETNDG